MICFVAKSASFFYWKCGCGNDLALLYQRIKGEISEFSPNILYFLFTHTHTLTHTHIHANSHSHTHKTATFSVISLFNLLHLLCNVMQQLQQISSCDNEFTCPTPPSRSSSNIIRQNININPSDNVPFLCISGVFLVYWCLLTPLR